MIECFRPLRRCVRLLLAVAGIAACGVLATADDVDERAKKVLAAHRAGDRAEVARLLSEPSADPAAVAGRLIDSGERDAALSIVEALEERFETLAAEHSYRRMIQPARQLVAVAERLGDPALVARWAGNLGSVLARLERFTEAAAAYAHGAAVARKAGLAEVEVAVLVNLGGLHSRTGRFALALEAFDRAVELLPDASDPSLVAFLVVATGDVWTELGELGRALAAYERALALPIGPDDPSRAHALASLGWALHLARDSEKAMTRLTAAAEAYAAAKDDVMHGNVLRALAQVRYDRGESEEALAGYERARALQRERDAEEAHTTVCLAQALVRLGRLDRAEEELRTASLLLEGSDATDVVIVLRREEAELALARGDPAGALRAVRDAFDRLSRVVGGLSDAGMIGAETHRDRSPLFDLAVRAAVRTGESAVVAELLEQTRAQALLYALGGRPALRTADDAVAVTPREREVKERLAKARAALLAAEGSGLLAEKKEAAEVLRRAEEDFQATRDALERATRRSESVRMRPVCLARMKELMGEGDAWVSYALLPGSAHALVVTRDRARIVPLGDDASLASACDELLERLAGRGDPAGKEARGLLIDPLGLPDTTRRLFVSPDGPIAHVPLGWLVRDRGIDVVFEPSATVYDLLVPQRGRTGTTVLALGDPEYPRAVPDAANAVVRGGALARLEGSRDEVLAITRDGDTRLLGPDASEGGLLVAASGRPRWSAVHFACHGIADSSRPGLSALALTPRPGEDGFLTALEVFQGGFAADLAVLSACRTGRGAYARSEGTMGLARAFLAAGIPRVLVSLWDVDDEATRDLMVRFYAGWRDEGLSLTDALRRAQDGVAAQPKWSHPKYWAAWVLWGLGD